LFQHEILLDQDVFATTRRFLSSFGHDVVAVSQLRLSRATDEELLKAVRVQGRIFAPGVARLDTGHSP
jgi:predicted nuclease of predicted toxin-antitoxin system